ncbi:MAG: peptidoglycan DD-metalloendopeptidase family protein [Candidatus Uhrbacteria bacterium]
MSNGEWARVSMAAESSATGTVKKVFDLQRAIEEKQGRLERIRQEINQYSESISGAQAKSRTLRGQLAIIETRIAKQRLAIEEVTITQEEVELEFRATTAAADRARDRLARERVVLIGVLTELRAAEQQPIIQAILAEQSIGAYFARRDQLALIQGNLARILASVRTEHEALKETERTLEERQRELGTLAERLVDEQEALAAEQATKGRLLTSTKQNEQRYQSLVAELRAEQGAIDSDIVALDHRIREQLTAIDAEFGKDGKIAFSWPVTNRGITAYFHDPEYPYRYIFEHPAIDIRASQGGSIKAPAPGYVARTRDAGYGYSYLMLVHPGGFSTVYGHVSCFKVKEGEYVTRGQDIACVGGKPGTRGAGNLTSGSHLHFEIRMNGIPVNPMNYLL